MFSSPPGPQPRLLAAGAAAPGHRRGAANTRPAQSWPYPAAVTEAVSYPGARRPDRRRTVAAAGLQLAVYEWGDPNGPPILLTHGGFDFAGTFDVFAPL